MSTARRPGFGRRREGGRRYFNRRRVCSFCVDKVVQITYKDLPRLQRFISDRARIAPRRRTGTCTKHQRLLSVALKRARHLALLPYAADHVLTMGAASR